MARGKRICRSQALVSLPSSKLSTAD